MEFGLCQHCCCLGTVGKMAEDDLHAFLCAPVTRRGGNGEEPRLRGSICLLIFCLRGHCPCPVQVPAVPGRRRGARLHS